MEFRTMSFVEKFKRYDFPTMGYIKMPSIDIPEDDLSKLGLLKNSNPDKYLRALSDAGFKIKLSSGLIPKDKIKEYQARKEEELNVIISLGFSSYILLVYKILKFCKDNNIPNSPARGSVGGSLVCWLIDIISIDPIEYGLLFSRFLSASRTEKKEINGEIYIKSDSLPDIDIDSSHAGKPLVKLQLEKMYPGRTVGIANLSTLSSKLLIKEILKIVLEWNEQAAQDVSNMIEREFGKVPSILTILEKNEKFKKWAEDKSELIEICCKLQDLIKNKSVHAAGILLCNDPVINTIPMELDKSGVLVSSYDMDSAQMFGIKVDNLAVLTLDICHDCAQLAGKKLSDINPEDNSIYKFLNTRNEFYGLFQISEGLGKQTIQKIKPTCVKDISASLALGRPGAMKWIDEYVENKIDIDSLDPRVREVLRDTHGIIVYQETLMKLSMVMAGFDGEGANKLRKGIGKKKKEIIASLKEKFIQGSLKNNFKQEFVDWVWSSIEASADYSFNCCLSPDTMINTESGYKKMSELKIGDSILALDPKSLFNHYVEIVNVYHSKSELYEVEMENGTKIEASLNHKFLCEDFKMHKLEEIINKNLKILFDK